MQSPATFYSELSVIQIRSDQNSKDEVVDLAFCFLWVCPIYLIFLQGAPALTQTCRLEGTGIRHSYPNVNESLLTFGTLCLILYQKLGL